MHFYQQTDNGVEPRHYVPMSTRPNELRPSRMSDLRAAAKRGEAWVPSVTTILNVLDKPALGNWKVDQHLQQAWKIAQQADPFGESIDNWIAEVKRLTELHMDIAPSAGTDVHKVLEEYAAGALKIGHPQFELCQNVFAKIADETGLTTADFRSEVNFVHEAGFGGMADLVSDNWIFDLKSKQFAEKFKPKKMVYPEHYMQLSAYREGLTPPGIIRRRHRCANIFVCLENGAIDLHEHSAEDLERGYQLFKHCLAIWQLQNGA